MKRFWYYFPVVAISVAGIGIYLPKYMEQKFLLLAFFTGGFLTIMAEIRAKKLAGRREPIFDYIFPVLFCFMTCIIGYLWRTDTTGFLAFFMLLILTSKILLLGLNRSFRWYNLLLYAVLFQLLWEFSYAMKWVEYRPFIRAFVQTM